MRMDRQVAEAAALSRHLKQVILLNKRSSINNTESTKFELLMQGARNELNEPIDKSAVCSIETQSQLSLVVVLIARLKPSVN